MPADASRLRTRLGTWATQVAAVAGPETALLAQRDARVPVGDTRELVGSIRDRGSVSVSGTSRTVEVIAPVIQAATTDKGARAHRIQGRPLLVFHWPKVGRIVYLRHVNHPGNPPKPWWEAVLRDAWRQAIRTAARRTPL